MLHAAGTMVSLLLNDRDDQHKDCKEAQEAKYGKQKLKREWSRSRCGNTSVTCTRERVHDERAPAFCCQRGVILSRREMNAAKMALGWHGVRGWHGVAPSNYGLGVSTRICEHCDRSLARALADATRGRGGGRGTPATRPPFCNDEVSFLSLSVFINHKREIFSGEGATRRVKTR